MLTGGFFDKNQKFLKSIIFSASLTKKDPIKLMEGLSRPKIQIKIEYRKLKVNDLHRDHSPA